MNKARDLKHLVLGATLAASGLSAIAAVNLTTFTPGTPIKSAEVNANFSSLRANIEALQAPGGIGGAQLAAGSVDASKLSATGGADGKVLKLQGGALAWADDLVGTGGGTAYSAGGGLALTGTTFSIADGGVTAGKLSATGGADGKVLKLQAGNLTWSDDLTGGGGSAYSADGSSLQLSGTTFSVKDGGIGAAKIADGAVTSAKLAAGAVTNAKLAASAVASGNVALPLTLTGNFIPTLGIRNADASMMGLLVDLGPVPGSFTSGKAIMGRGNNSVGVYGESQNFDGVQGKTVKGNGVFGNSDQSTGVYGLSTSGKGVWGQSSSQIGVEGDSDSSYGVYGTSAHNNAVYGVTTGTDTNATAVAATSANGYAAYFEAGTAVCKFHAGTTNWACSSDRNLKEHFKAVNTAHVLEAVARMPVTTWNMKGSRLRQMGPTAQDFYAAFHLGDSDKSINNTDAQGVALAAIQGLNRKLETENAALKAALGKLEARVKTLEHSAGSR